MTDQSLPHRDTEPCPADPDTDPGGHATIPASDPPLALDDAARDGLLCRLAAGIEALDRDVARRDREIMITLRALCEQGDRIEGAIRLLAADIGLALHEERRHGSELASVRADLDGLACRRGGNGHVPDDCAAAE
jgi:hypothetical protein